MTIEEEEEDKAIYREKEENIEHHKNLVKSGKQEVLFKESSE